MCVHVCVSNMHVSCKSTSGVFFNCSLFLRQALSVSLKLSNSADKPQGYFCPCFSGALVKRMRCAYAWLFHGC